MKILANNLEQMEAAGALLASAMENRSIVTFEGEMGAGKTTLIRFICSALGVIDEVSSPTFSLVNEYVTTKGSVIYHFDLYRLDSPEEALDFGIEEYLESGNLCLIEWADKLGAFLPEEAAKVQIQDDEGVRQIFFQP